MSRFLITVNGAPDREKAARWCMAAKPGMRIEFKQAKRSGEQNDRLWAMLTEVAAQVPWHGIKLSPDDWKFIFLDALKRELRMVPNIDGTGFVNLGRSSSDLSKEEMSNLIELIHAFGADHNVVFRDPETISSSSQSHTTPSETDKPAAEMLPTSDAAGDLQQESSAMPPADDVSGGDGAADKVGDTPSPPMPEGWSIRYCAALRRAHKKESLPKLAAQFWLQHGGWEQHKTTADGATAAEIFNIFRDNFGDGDQIDALLREIV